MKIQLDDFKVANADLVDQLDKAQKNVAKMKLKVCDWMNLNLAAKLRTTSLACSSGHRISQ